jgi:citrate lyase subunit beta / citryl-CoA lyase
MMSESGPAGGWEPGPAWLFCPADRPDRYAKAYDRGDVVILHLVDAVAPGSKDDARAALRKAELDLDRTVVRVNPAGGPDHALDLEAVDDAGVRRVMLPKAESGADVDVLAPREVIVLVESSLGLRRLDELARPDHVIGMMCGAEDLLADLGGTSSRRDDGSYRDVAAYARSDVLVAAKAYRRIALDSVYMDIADADGLRAESEDAVATGFDAKAAIHPSQVPVIRDAFAPDETDISWATRLLEAASQQRGGVFTFEGRMVDGPVFRQAERIIRLAAVARRT